MFVQVSTRASGVLLSFARCRLRNVYAASVLLLVTCLVVLIINVRELRLMQAEHAAADHVTRDEADVVQLQRLLRQPLRGASSQLPVVWIYGKKLEAGYLKHVFEIFERIGFATGDDTSDWSVLWSHDYPFNVLRRQLQSLKPYQKINHFPGSGSLTNKGSLLVSDISVIPKAFRIPAQHFELLQYSKEHPGKLWVQKGSSHRGIRITTVNEMNLHGSEMIVQEYVDNPLLIDGRRFDIGLYVTLTSVNPLRVYVYQGEWLIRFCSKVYNPFNASDIDKYVITDEYTPPWEIPSIAKFYTDLGCTRKEALFAYFRSIGKDPDKVNRDLEAAIREVSYAKEAAMIEAMLSYPTRIFFEMVRFDFVLDRNLNVYLMEVNMSPNLSSGHFAQNKLLYEQVIYNTLSLVGIASTISPDVMRRNLEDSTNMQVSSRDLRVYLDICSTSCAVGCQQQICKLCRGCVAADDESTIRSAYQEHMRQGTWSRVVPKAVQTQEAARRWNMTSDNEFKLLRPMNQIMLLWYNGKCLQHPSWCL